MSAFGSHARPTRRLIHRVTLATAITSVTLLLCSGCGDDIEIYKPPPYSPYLALTSPENVIHNLAEAYNNRNCERVEELLCDEFVFVFNEDDVWNYHEVPDEGWWGYSDEVLATNKMLDRDHEPADPQYKIDEIEIALELSGQLTPYNDEGAPNGTLEGYVTLELTAEAGGGTMTLRVHTRPLFFFAPDSTQSPVSWCLWRCEDGPFLDGTGSVLGTAGGTENGQKSAEGNPAAYSYTPTSAAGETATWGRIKAFYHRN